MLRCGAVLLLADDGDEVVPLIVHIVAGAVRTEPDVFPARVIRIGDVNRRRVAPHNVPLDVPENQELPFMGNLVGRHGVLWGDDGILAQIPDSIRVASQHCHRFRDGREPVRQLLDGLADAFAICPAVEPQQLDSHLLLTLLGVESGDFKCSQPAIVDVAAGCFE